MNTELFIARRIYADKGEGGKSFSRPAVRIAMAGIAIGIAVMIVSLAVVSGFKREVASKVMGFGSHVQVLSLTQTYEHELLPVLTNDSLKRVVSQFHELDHVQRFAVKMGMLKTEDNFCGITFKGLSAEYDTTFLASSLLSGRIPRQLKGDDTKADLLISNTIAQQLGLKTGSRVFAYFINKEGMRARRFTVSGIYETHMTEYDKLYAYTDMRSVQKLNGWTDEMTSGYEITVKDFERVNLVAEQMAAKMNGPHDRNGVTYGVFSIRQLAGHTFSWLDVLDMNVVMIIILMVCVSAFTIVSGLLIIMLERVGMIGILKALGATNFSVRKVFFHLAVMLVGKGMVIGNILGIGICLIQQHWHIIKLDAATYYLSSVPIEMNWIAILLVNLLTLLASSLVIFGASHLISISKPVKSMRWE